LEKTLAYAQMLARRAPLSHRFAKEMIRTSMGMNMPDALKAESRSFRDFAMTADLEEGLTSFRERRDAEFTAS
jgi:enoyl-CoA hydratase/carnithine racemase